MSADASQVFRGFAAVLILIPSCAAFLAIDDVGSGP